ERDDGRPARGVRAARGLDCLHGPGRLRADGPALRCGVDASTPSLRHEGGDASMSRLLAMHAPDAPVAFGDRGTRTARELLADAAVVADALPEPSEDS